jgi:hypothetical protein
MGLGLSGRDREWRPYRAPRGLETPRTSPAVLGRRVHVRGVRGWASHARETKGAVVGHRDRAGVFTEFQDSFAAQGEPRLIEGVEILEDQQRHRLTQIERRLADRAEEIAGIEFGNAHADAREVGGGNHHRGLQRTAQARKVEAVVNVRRVRYSNEHGMRRGLRPVGEIGCTKIRCVELGSHNLGHAVDATDPGGGGIPALPPRQRLARGKVRFLGDCQGRDAERNAARRGRFDEVTSRNSHCAALYCLSSLFTRFIDQVGDVPLQTHVVQQGEFIRSLVADYAALTFFGDQP